MALDSAVLKYRSRRAAEEAAQAERAREIEAEVQRVLALPSDTWLSRDCRLNDPPVRYHELRSIEAGHAAARDPRVLAKRESLRAWAEEQRRAHVERAIESLVVTCKTRRYDDPKAEAMIDITWGHYSDDERERIKADARTVAKLSAMTAEIQRAQAALAAAREDLIAYARETDDLARAARDGYDVAAAAFDHIVQAVASYDDSATILVHGSPAYEDAEWEERKAPRRDAFETLDRVTKHVASVRRPACVSIEVSRVMRFTPPTPERESYEDEVPPKKFTAVPVTVSSPVAPTRVVVFPAER